MNKNKKCYGIDISKDVFDVMDENDNHSSFSNTMQGFKEFKKKLPPDSVVTMEATGVYHVQLADYLFLQNVFVSVVNPLVIKRFIQMKMRRVKTDKADAQMICKYGVQNELKAYEPVSLQMKEARILTENIDLLVKSRNKLKNRLHALSHKSERTRAGIINPMKKSISELNKQIKRLEDELKQIIHSNYHDLYSRLQTIPGIGSSTAMLYPLYH